MTSERRGLPRIGSHLDCIQKLARSMTYDVAAAKVLEWLDERATGGHPDHRQPDERFRKSADIIRLQAVDLTALRAERDSLAAQVYVPGLWKCAKCNFRLMQSNLNMGDGTITARNDPGDKCPNCNSPLWRVSEREDRMDAQKTANDLFDKCHAAEKDRDSLAAQLGQAKLVIEGEQEARWKLEAAYRMKDEAVGKLMALCQKRGIDLSELIP